MNKLVSDGSVKKINYPVLYESVSCCFAFS